MKALFLELKDPHNDTELFEVIATRLGHLNNNGLETMYEYAGKYYFDTFHEIDSFLTILNYLSIDYTITNQVQGLSNKDKFLEMRQEDLEIDKENQRHERIENILLWEWERDNQHDLDSQPTIADDENSKYYNCINK